MKESIILQYLKKHRKSMIFFLLCSVIFYITLYLYHLPAESVLYAALLSITTGLVILIPDYIQFYRKHWNLQKLSVIKIYSMDDLPEPENQLEEDYIHLIEQLYAEKQKLEMAVDTRSTDMIDYYTMWVHQIKTPIAALRLLLQTFDTDTCMELKPELSAELFKIEQYVEMVLSYIRMESMSSDLLLKKYSVDDIVKQAIRKYATLFIHKKIQLSFSELNTEVLTDEKWLVFVVEQVLSNAIKYTMEGGKIDIYIEKESKTLVIEDTGIGIQSEDLPRVFEKGFTGYNGRTDKKSSGIGLYLCKSILIKLSHTIKIESNVGKGTKVKIGLDSIDIVIE